MNTDETDWHGSEGGVRRGLVLKRLVYGVLCFVPLPLLVGGIVAYRRQQSFLAERGLDGMVFIVLIMLGLMLLLNPITLAQGWEKKTAVALLTQFLTVSGGMILVLGGLFTVFGLVAFILSLPARFDRPYLLLPLLILAAPLFATIVDMIVGDLSFSARNLGVGYAVYAFKIYFLLLIQFVVIGIGFVLFPAGFFLQLLSIVTLIVGWVQGSSELPLLCNWFGIGEATCTPALFGLHIGHIIAVLIVMVVADRWLDLARDWFQGTTEQLAGWVKK